MKNSIFFYLQIWIYFYMFVCLLDKTDVSVTRRLILTKTTTAIQVFFLKCNIWKYHAYLDDVLFILMTAPNHQYNIQDNDENKYCQNGGLVLGRKFQKHGRKVNGVWSNIKGICKRQTVLSRTFTGHFALVWVPIHL